MRSRAFPRTVGRAGDAPSPATTSGFAAFWVAVRRPSGRQPAGNRGGGTGDLRIGGGWGLLGPGSFDEDCHQPHHLFPLLGAHGDQLGFFKLDRSFQCVIRGSLRPSVPGSRPLAGPAAPRPLSYKEAARGRTWTPRQGEKSGNFLRDEKSRKRDGSGEGEDSERKTASL